MSGGPLHTTLDPNDGLLTDAHEHPLVSTVPFIRTRRIFPGIFMYRGTAPPFAHFLFKVNSGKFILSITQALTFVDCE